MWKTKLSIGCPFSLIFPSNTKTASAHGAKKTKGKATEQSGSFDTDDFFDAAMRKSLGDHYDEIMKKE